MSHGMEERDRMFTVRKAPWHLGSQGGTTTEQVAVIAEYPGRERAMQLAGHDFTVVERPIGIVPIGMDEEVDPELTFEVPIDPRFKALAREDNGEVLDVVKRSWTPVQNDLPWDVIDALVSEPEVHYETGGTLHGGALCWVLAALNEPFEVAGDASAVYPYAVVTWGHRFGYAFKAVATAVRIECWNTWSAAMAEGERSGLEFTFRHTAGVFDRIEEARETLMGIRGQFAEFRELADELAAVKVTMRKVDAFLAEFLPAPPVNETSELVKRHIDEARARVKTILERPSGAGLTKWGVLQAGIEYLDYGRPYRSDGALLGRTILRPAPMKKKLVKLVRSL